MAKNAVKSFVVAVFSRASRMDLDRFDTNLSDQS